MDAARSLRGKVVDSIRGVHEAAFFLTGHDHWKKIEQSRRVAAADPIAEAIIVLPAAAQASILKGLAWSSLALVVSEMFVAPAVTSYKIKQTEKKKAVDTEKGKESVAEQPA